MTLTEKLHNIVDEYYIDSDDFRLLNEVAEEIDFLHSRGILAEKKLGRLIDIIENNGAE